MTEPEKVSFKVTESLFKQLSEWQEKIEAADRLEEESEAEKTAKASSQGETYGQKSNTENL